MSTSPVPPGADTSGEWRASVQQSYRNTEVREISRVLAALEPGATAGSKLRLAMQFEDAVFKSASSLADYHKKLTRRLKKLQKNYRPPAPQERTSQGAVNTSNKDAVLKELRQTYGETLLYILKHADTAVEEMRKRHGEEKARQLKQHTDGVKMWVEDLGLGEGQKVNLRMSTEQLEKLKGHLEKRTENIRSHVVKLADPDQFMAEMLAKREQEFTESSTRPSRILAECSRRRYEHLYQQIHKDKPVQPEQLLAESLKSSQLSVPVPTNRTNSQQSDEKAALVHLQKMRAASTVLLAYMLLPDKTAIAKNKVVSKAHAVASEGIEFTTKVMKIHRENTKEPKVSLEDAWMKPIVLNNGNDVTSDTGNVDDGSPRKRQRTNNRPVVRSRLLLTPNRKTPSNLLPALKRKRAQLVRPPPSGKGSHLILEFGDAFVMTIYFVPLVVTLRAMDKSDTKKKASDTTECASWTPLHHGLTERTDLTVWGATGDYNTLGRAVEERLRDASVHATAVLRQCFSGAAKATAEFEVEILEATALLEFLQAARTTFIPDWQDDDS